MIKDIETFQPNALRDGAQYILILACLGPSPMGQGIHPRITCGDKYNDANAAATELQQRGIPTQPGDH